MDAFFPIRVPLQAALAVGLLLSALLGDVSLADAPPRSPGSDWPASAPSMASNDSPRASAATASRPMLVRASVDETSVQIERGRLLLSGTAAEAAAMLSGVPRRRDVGSAPASGGPTLVAQQVRLQI